MRWVLLVLSVVASACCKVYCPAVVTLVLVDANGSPLTPESVTLLRPVPEVAGFNDPMPCGGRAVTSPARVACDGNRISFDLQSSPIRVKATTGEVFEGEVSPEWRPNPKPDGVCECSGQLATLELTLSPP